jgi:hypothetical protein
MSKLEQVAIISKSALPQFIFFEIIVPTNEVPPAKAVIAITVMMSIASMGVVIIIVWLNYSKNKDNINGLL